ncbi:MAG TPA: glucoamylase family protein [Polyangiaceae bacterium]
MTIGESAVPIAPSPCPGVGLGTQWDDAAHLRGELHTAERLAHHAIEVARAHGVPSLAVPPGPLRQRFAVARERIARAYDILSRSSRARHEPSPAEEWLLDNSHVVDDQIREVQEDLPWGYLVELPRLAHGKMRGYPRVYGLCLDYLRHTDGRVDLPTLVSYVSAYQTVHQLAIGELWAIPIMLRVGLVLAASALAASEAGARDRERGETWAARVIERGRTPQRVATVLAQLEREDPPVTADLLVEIVRRLREHEAPLATAIDWVASHCGRMGISAEELVRRHHLKQAADQVSVGNAITSMRAIGALDWNAFFERTSTVEKLLRRDPARVYAAMDIATRDRYRHAVERIARRSSTDEPGVADAALRLAKRGRARRRELERGHVGYWLVGDGRAELEQRVHFRPPLDQRLTRAILRFPSAFYFGALAVLTAVTWMALSPAGAALAALLFVPATEIALAFLNSLVVAVVPPRVLPKMGWERGIPPEHRTLVVVPALLDGPDGVARLLESLEIRSLANLDDNLHFALLTDFCDADREHEPEDDALVAQVERGIADLDARWSRPGEHRYMLFHRRRVRDATGRWMGWERKRGKLEELNRLLRNGGDGTYEIVTAPRELLAHVRYVLTLDADTDLPRDTARKLAATMAHPLNRPRLSPTRARVARGHGVIQPRVGTRPDSARRTRWTRLASTPIGLDPYTTAVSDVYQDLFDQGSFVGKGIYDVDAFAAALDGRVPEGRLLSHDLFEGLFARSALASDIEVLDEQPSSYEVTAARQHRWIRGDWQMLPWLVSRDLTLLDRWKIFDNLRRSLVAPAIVVACSFGWLHGTLAAALATSALVAIFLVPVFTSAVLAATQARNPTAFVGAASADIAANALRSFIQTIFLLDATLLAVDAIGRTFWRLFLSRRRLLEWTTMSQSERRAGRSVHPRLVIAASLAVLGLVAVALRAPWDLPFAAPPLLLWAASPAVAWWLRKPEPEEAPTLAPLERKELRLVARRTWRFFETFVTEADHFLPPDNFQEDPRGVLARRTSPTNIGLYLLSVGAAHDFGFISLGEAVRRWNQTLDTLDKLTRHEGHILNWYDTATLAPLEPRYVSTVDSGNLAAYLWTVRETCEDLARAPCSIDAHLEAADDALALAVFAEPHDEIESLRAELASARAELTGDATHDRETLRAAAAALASALGEPWAQNGASDVQGGVRRAARLLADVIEERARLDAPEAREAMNASLHAVGERACALAEAMSFRFLLDEERKLFSIGYNVTTARLDAGFYDLLASEARLASLVAIAKGEAPQEHWFRLGRPRARVSRREGPVLLSWSGSMFEFLMPLLVTKNFEGTLLDQTYHAAVQRQMDYGVERAVPWGVSESAFNLMDLAMTYQYRAFGVPGLGLKAGLAEDLVVAPYATALAAQVRPRAAAENFRTLARMRALGAYGFYDAVDFTPRHLPPGRTSVLVKTFMAHHQGMTLVALDNALNGAPMQRRFHESTRIKSSELLLQERVPARAPLAQIHAAMLRTPQLNEPELDVAEHVGLGAHPTARLHLLGHGELSSAITVLGEGFTTWKGLDVHRFREDAAIEAGGLYVYLRDRESHRVWSAGFAPTRAEPDYYDVQLAIDRVEIVRRDGDIETTTEIVVSPERPAEVRRVTLANHGSSAREIELTTYAEVVLAPRAADVAHRAFVGMFVETEALPEQGALLARRRPRGESEEEVWLAQVLFAEGGAWQEGVEWETSRAKFVGRGHTTADPIALAAPLGKTTGAVLDPVLAMRRVVRLEPGGHARITLTSALATSREEALELVAISATPHILPRAFELAWADARVELRHLGVSAAQSHRFQRLLSAIVFPQPALRASIDRRDFDGHGRGGLWAHGISGDLPIVVVRIDHPDFADLFAELLRAHEFFRLNGVAIDLVALNEELPGYMQPQQQTLLSVVRASPGAARLDQRGGVFVRRMHEMTEGDRMLLLADARVVLAASRGSLARQLRRITVEGAARPADLVPSRKAQELPSRTPPRPALGFDNGIGGFAEGGREYVATVSESSLPPMPWSNVMARAHFGTLVTESGASFTWFENSQRHRLTPWSNDPISDPSGETFFLRDDEDGSVWSPTPLPAGGDATFTVRHGQGYSVFEHTRGDLAVELIVFVSPNECAKTWRIRVRNEGKRARSLSLFGIVEWVLGETREKSRVSVMTEWDAAVPAILAENPLSLHPNRRAFFTASAPIASVSGDRDEVFGAAGSRRRPVALERVSLSNRVGTGLDPCAALQVPVKIAAGETTTVSFVLGESDSGDTARTVARHQRDPAVIERELAEAKAAWDRMLGSIVVRTPDSAFDMLVGRWLLYQVASCRVFGRSAFYQSGGAYGFRDQIQDVLALLHARPDVAREHLVRCAARQFLEGDVQHWWHPSSGEGVRTRCSDDMLWLPFAVAEYVRVTGDEKILDERVSFLKERLLEATDEDIFSAPAITQEKATLYEHCTRALDRGATQGPHGLPKMGAGDWNDGMNRVGREGCGESVWLAFFLAKTLRDFSAVARARGDDGRVRWCEAEVDRLGEAVDASAWDGAWYLRAFFDDGTPLGSHANVECRIDAIAQSWAVVAGIGDRERAARALASAESELVNENAALMRLLWPPFESAPPDPGYIRAYPRGIRENGGQYTHGVLWTVLALAMMGQGERAMRLFSMLNPVHHGATRESIERYCVEPYVVAADVYDAPDHADGSAEGGTSQPTNVGRGGWTWYTGAAGWMYRIAIEHILGVRREGARLAIDPCVPKSWKQFEIDYRDGEGVVHVVVENPDGVEHGVARIEIDGRESGDGAIALTGAPGRREVRVVMGKAADKGARADETARRAARSA